jgi:hypothetical protein
MRGGDLSLSPSRGRNRYRHRDRFRLPHVRIESSSPRRSVKSLVAKTHVVELDSDSDSDSDPESIKPIKLFDRIWDQVSA